MEGKQIDLMGTVEHEWRHYLNDDEKHQISAETVQLHNKIDKLTANKKLQIKVLTTEIDNVKAEELELRTALNQGFKDFTGRVIVKEDFEARTVSYIDPATGEEVDSRAMTSKELRGGSNGFQMSAS